MSEQKENFVEDVGLEEKDRKQCSFNCCEQDSFRQGGIEERTVGSLTFSTEQPIEHRIIRQANINDENQIVYKNQQSNRSSSENYEQQIKFLKKDKKKLEQDLILSRKREEDVIKLLRSEDYLREIKNLLQCVSHMETQTKNLTEQIRVLQDKLFQRECHLSNLSKQKQKDIQQYLFENTTLRKEVEELKLVNLKLSDKITQNGIKKKELEHNLQKKEGLLQKQIKNFTVIREQLIKYQKNLQQDEEQIKLLGEENNFLRETIQHWEGKLIGEKERKKILETRLTETIYEYEKLDEKFKVVQEELNGKQFYIENQMKNFKSINESLLKENQQVNELYMKLEQTKKSEKEQLVEEFNQHLKNLEQKQSQKQNQYQANLKEIQKKYFEQKVALEKEYRKRQRQNLEQITQLKMELERKVRSNIPKMLRNKPRIYFLLYEMQQEIARLKRDLLNMKTRTDSQLTLLNQFLTKNLQSYKMKLKNIKYECQLCEHENKFKRQTEKKQKQNNNGIKGKYNKKQIEILKAKYRSITEKNELMLNKIGYSQ